ncbi:MAG: hypothetical protein ACK5MV_12755 [Aminipila sp.]
MRHIKIVKKEKGLNPLTELRKSPLVLENITYDHPNVKHWHGAKADSWFSHISVEVPGENGSDEWCEPILEGDYSLL